MFGWFKKKGSNVLVQRRAVITGMGISALALSYDGSAAMREKKFAQAGFIPMVPDLVSDKYFFSWRFDLPYPSSRIVYEDGTATKWMVYKGLSKQVKAIETRTMDAHGRIRYVQHKIG